LHCNKIFYFLFFSTLKSYRNRTEQGTEPNASFSQLKAYRMTASEKPYQLRLLTAIFQKSCPSRVSEDINKCSGCTM